MNNQQYICGRDESPETCFLCKQEDKDYCIYCADSFTIEEAIAFGIEYCEHPISVSSTTNQN